MTLRSPVALTLMFVLLTGTAGAHHNMSALYDFNNRVTLNGTLTKFDWRNPHIQLIVEVSNNGQMETWTLEGPPPVFFKERDISKSDFENAFSKTVTAEASRARDGSKAGLLRTMTLPGGKLVSACPQNC
jgi:Family of unknown function (DUF6152)